MSTDYRDGWDAEDFDDDERDQGPGYYCCLSPSCGHDRDQVFNGGSGG